MQFDSTEAAGFVLGDTTVAPEDKHTLYYYSVDTAGNTETVKSAVIKVNTTPWQQVNADGFGNPQNQAAYTTVVNTGFLYTGAWNSDIGGEIWRTSNGTDWDKVASGGFGDPAKSGIWASSVFNGYIYAGTDGGGPSGVWRSANGSTWEPVVTNGFGDANNIGIDPHVVFNNHLYAATPNNSTGGEMWRSSNGTTWNQVGADGFGDPNNRNMKPQIVFNGYIYAYTGNPVAGGQIWRSANGADWSRANPDNFGNPNNRDIGNQMAVFGNYLYTGVANYAEGAQVWRTANGTDWEQMVSGGINDANNKLIRGLSTFGAYLYAGTRNNVTGAEVWRSANGTDWEQINSDGFGDPGNYMIHGWFGQLGDSVYIAADNDAGAQVWKLGIGADTTPPVTSLETSPSSPNGLNGWFKTNPTVTLNRNESGTTYAQFDSTDTAGFVQTDSTIAPEGVHTLYYYSVDSVGNAEGINSEKVKVDTSAWQQVAPSGFGDRNNQMLLLSFQGNYKGELYAGSENQASGGRTWKTSDGFNWTTTTVGGFGGDSDNQYTGPGGNYFGYLYGVAGNGTDTVSLWRSTNGSAWASIPLGLTPVQNVGWGGGAWAGILFKGDIYAGTWGISGGGVILRSSDGLNWATSTPAPGFGDPTMTTADPHDVWKGYLYGSSRGPSGGGKLFRTANGTDWSEIVINGDPANTRGVNAVTGFNGYLYIGKEDGTIWRTANLSTWTTATAKGFGDHNNGAWQGSFRTINGRLYVTTDNGATGSEVWRTANGTEWENISPAWDANNMMSTNGTLYKGRIYLETRNTQTGGEIWSMPFNNTPAGSNVSPDLGGAATLTFPQVTAPGSTAVWAENWIGPANPPSGYSFLETYYDISTDASHTGSITLSIPYNQAEVTGTEQNLKIMHWDELDQTWGVLPTIVDTAGNKVTAQTSSLSVFVIAEAPGDASPPSTPLLTALSPSPSSIELSWPAATDNIGVSGYAIFNGSTDATITTTTATSRTFTGLTSGNAYSYYIKAHDAAGNYSARSNVVTLTPGAGGTTGAGTGEASVTVSPIPALSMTFADITTSGVTSITELPITTLTPPSGFQFEGNQYEITTTASYVPPIQVAIEYDESALSGPEADLRMFHCENGAWLDVTLYVDTENNIVVGEVDSLSPFVLGGPSTPATGLNHVILIVMALLMMGAGIRTVSARRPGL